MSATARRLLAVLVSGVLVTGTATQYAAAQPTPDVPRGIAEARPGSSAAADVPDVALAPAGDAIVTSRRDTPVAPGVTQTAYESLDARGWNRGDVLVADLTKRGVSVDYLNPGTVSAREPVSQQLTKRHAIAGVNGDFFDITDTGAPLGVGIQGGKLLNAPAAGHNETAVIGANGLGRLAQVFLTGSATDDDGSTVALSNLNSPQVDSGGVGLYTAQWGAVPLDRTIDGVPAVREVILRDGTVVSNSTTVATAPLADDEQALIGREAGASSLENFEPGEKVAVSYAPRSDAKDLAVAISGDQRVAQDGKVLPVDDEVLAPRTAIGFSADGKQMLLLSVDGRQADARGATLRELGETLVRLGAADALNLDGGGSTTMLVRPPGEPTPEVVNNPSDGEERIVPNGLGLVPAPGSGRLTGFRVEPLGTAAEQEDVDVSTSTRVLRGLTRVLAAHGHDETYAPVAATPHWTSGPNASVAGGMVTGRRSGPVRVTASKGAARGDLALTVLGTPTRLAPSTRQVALPQSTSSGRFVVNGYDADGFGTWVEPRDVKLEYDPSIVKVVADRNGFAVTPVAASGVATVVTAKVGTLRTDIAVTVGLETTVVDSMDDLGKWKATAVPAVVGSSASVAEGHEPGGKAVALDYSLTGTTATRAAYLEMTTQTTLPGAPQRVGAWVYGDGKGAWLRAHYYDAAGGSFKTVNLAPAVDWVGWKYVEGEIPAGLTMPLKFWRIYVVETVPTKQYSGRIVVDDLTVRSAPVVSLPPAPKVTDSMVRPLTGNRWRFAVLSDAQFTSDDPDSIYVKQARRTIREALAQRPEFLVINGDFVDRGFAGDIALAKRIIDEEVAGTVPVHYVPGNHEAYGPGDLSEWTKVFGKPWSTFDHNGTRFVLRDSSLGSLRAGGFDQIADLRRQLDDAATNKSVKNVVVMAHHPIDDPSPTANSQLGDRKEAKVLTQWLADFRARTGKGAAYMAAHAGTFAATRTDGVLLPLTGNSGKDPAAAPGEGGFTGWALVGIDRFARPAGAGRTWSAPENRTDPWFAVELRPHVDTLELAAPATVARGTSAPVEATVVQLGRRIPVGFPVTAQWSGSWNLFIGPAANAPWYAVASYDPATGKLTGRYPGTIRLTLEVNEVTQSATVRVS